MLILKLEENQWLSAVQESFVVFACGETPHLWIIIELVTYENDNLDVPCTLLLPVYIYT